MSRDYLRYLSIAVCLCLPCVAWAQSQDDRTKDVDTAGLVIEPVAGWRNSVDPTTPVPISFLIENFSDETIEGRLFLSTPYNNNRKIDLGEVFIGPASKRRFSTIRGDLDNIYECYAEIQVEGKVIWRRQIPLTINGNFSQDVVHCMFISDAERNLRLPSTKKTQNANAPQSPVANNSGRRVSDFTVKSWQVPDHPGALSVAQGIVFEENFDVKLLNRAQWNALANWMCQGGHVFVHDKSQNIIKKLLASSPLSSSAPTQSEDQFRVREAGLGKICEYSEPLFSSDKATRQSIVNRMSFVPRNGIRGLAQQSSVDRRTSGNASWNRLFLLTFFGAYAILSGLITMLLFRLSRRQIAIYTMTVVIGACIAAAMLGGALRFSRGDVQWLTITQPGVGGLLQVAKMEASSAGARTTTLAVTGENVDLQTTAARRQWQWNNVPAAGYPAFTWQPNLAKDSDNTYQVDVAMTPWGGRQLIGTAFKRTEANVEFELDFIPGAAEEETDADAVQADNSKATAPTPSQYNSRGREWSESVVKAAAGEFRIRLKNNLPFHLTHCRVVVGVTAKYDTKLADQMGQQDPWRNQLQHFGSGVDAQIDVYQVFFLPDLLPNGDEKETNAEASMSPRHQWEHRLKWDEGTIFLPRIARIGTASAWLIATVKSSPIIEVDESKSSFSANDEFHIYMQEILPEDMPDASVFVAEEAGP